MRIIYLFIFISLYVAIQAQDTALTKSDILMSKPPRLFIGFNVMAGVSFRNIHGTLGTVMEQAVVHLDNDLDRVKFGYGAGIDMTYLFAKHFGFKSGLYYINRGWQSRWYTIYFTPNRDSAYSFKIQTSYHFAQIPISIAGRWGKGKVKFVCSAGVTIDILIATQNQGTMLYEGKEVYDHTRYNWVKTGLYNPVSMSANVSAGIDYAISYKMGVKIEPSFNHQFIPLNAQGSVKHYLWNAGLNVAYYFGVKRKSHIQSLPHSK